MGKSPVVYIMAGGSGTRLKPLSQTGPGKLPKQFLALTGSCTLLQEAAARVPDEYEAAVIPEEQYSGEVRRQLALYPGREFQILSEPFGCNTAPAVLYAALTECEKKGTPGRVISFIPADHRMQKSIFQKLLRKACAAAENLDKIVTIGIEPTRPETNYGYIEAGGVKNACPEDFTAAAQFVEKPDEKRAEQYLAAGNYYWNAGMFIGKAEVFVREAEKHCTKLIELLRPAVRTGTDAALLNAYREIRSSSLAQSIDYALMEKISASMLLLPAPKELEWNDLGSWESLTPYMEKDEADNCWIGSSGPDVEDSTGCRIFNYTELPVTVKDCSGLVIIVSNNGILVRKSYGSST